MLLRRALLLLRFVRSLDGSEAILFCSHHLGRPGCFRRGTLRLLLLGLLGERFVLGGQCLERGQELLDGLEDFVLGPREVDLLLDLAERSLQWGAVAGRVGTVLLAHLEAAQVDSSHRLREGDIDAAISIGLLLDPDESLLPGVDQAARLDHRFDLAGFHAGLRALRVLFHLRSPCCLSV